MNLKHSISNAKSFFKKTIKSFESLLGGSYQKLPKGLQCYNIFSCTGAKDRRWYTSSSFRDLEEFYKDYANFSKGSSIQKPLDKRVTIKQAKEENNTYIASPVEEKEKRKRNVVHRGKDGKSISPRGNSQNRAEERKIQVAQKIKELKMMDEGNAEHLLDVEEVLHYYNRLTSPVYLDIVDMFFLDMCSELFGPFSFAHLVNCSWQRLQ